MNNMNNMNNMKKDHMRMIRRRTAAVLLALAVSVTMMPAFAFADELPAQEGPAAASEVNGAAKAAGAESGTAAADADAAADTGNAENAESKAAAQASKDSAAQVNEDSVSAGSGSSETAGIEEAEGTESARSAADAEAAEVTEGAKITEDAEDAEDAEEEIIEDLQLVNPGADLPDSDVLLTEYLENQAGVEIAQLQADEDADESADSGVIRQKAKMAARSAHLNTTEQQLYAKLKSSVAAIANGQSDTVKISIPMSSADYAKCSFSRIINSLVTDLPYELYWYDKTGVGGVLGGYQSGNFVAYFSVSKGYRSSAAPTKVTYNNGQNTFYLYKTDLSKTKAASAAVARAKKIVADNAGLSDIDKLNAYREAVCDLTSYNMDVSLTDDYGDPWQLIYVFDGNPATNVVCEGYAKSFQLLCDLTDFDNIQSHIAGGELVSPSKTEPHMWNVVQMDDGYNYLADITNCDSGLIGYPDKLFLKGCVSGSVEKGYTYQCGSSTVKYIYDDDTLNIYYTPELTMAAAAYSGSNPKAVRHRAVAATCTSAGTIEYWVRQGLYYKDCNCTEQINKADTAVGALGHSYGAWQTTRAATCTSAGTRQHKCTRCGRTESGTIAALGHAWKSSNTLDNVVHTCSRCHSSYTVSKVVVDLPKVSIKKPAAAKKAFTAKWGKVSKKNRKKIGGIEIQYSTSAGFPDSSSTVTTAKKTAAKKKISKKPRKTTYYVRVRSYKWISGKKHVSAWSAVKKVRTK